MRDRGVEIDRVRGVLLGAIVGDAFGSVLEGMSLHDAASAAARRADTPSPWRYTDDGAMTIAVAESLVQHSAPDGDQLMRSLLARYEPARGFGKGMKTALRAYESGTPWDECAFRAWATGSRGNGAAVRVGAIACVRWGSLEEIHAAARLAARVTHGHSEAIDAAVLWVHAARTVLSEPSSVDDPARFADALSTTGQALAPAIADPLRAVGDLIRSSATCVDVARELGTSALARESIPAALWAFLVGRASFRDAIMQAAGLGGDVDSICTLVGTLAGALHGMSSIPKIWLNNLAGERPTARELVEIADTLASRVAFTGRR